jgi:hypothetical protein
LEEEKEPATVIGKPEPPRSIFTRNGKHSTSIFPTGCSARKSIPRSVYGSQPGNAILLIGAVQSANREIGVPGFSRLAHAILVQFDEGGCSA